MEQDDKFRSETQDNPDQILDQSYTADEVDEDKQSDLDVPGGKGLIKEEIQDIKPASL